MAIQLPSNGEHDRKWHRSRTEAGPTTKKQKEATENDDLLACVGAVWLQPLKDMRANMKFLTEYSSGSSSSRTTMKWGIISERKDE